MTESSCTSIESYTLTNLTSKFTRVFDDLFHLFHLYPKLNLHDITILSKILSFTLENKASRITTFSFAKLLRCSEKHIQRGFTKLSKIGFISYTFTRSSKNKSNRISRANVSLILSKIKEAIKLKCFGLDSESTPKTPKQVRTISPFGSDNQSLRPPLGSDSQSTNKTFNNKQREREASPIPDVLSRPAAPSSLSKNSALEESPLSPLPDLKEIETSTLEHEDLQIDYVSQESLLMTRTKESKEIFNSLACRKAFEKKQSANKWSNSTHPFYVMVEIILKVARKLNKTPSIEYALRLIHVENGQDFAKVKKELAYPIVFTKKAAISPEENMEIENITKNNQRYKTLYQSLEEAASKGNIGSRTIIKAYRNSLELKMAVMSNKENIAKIEAYLASKDNKESLPNSLP